MLIGSFHCLIVISFQIKVGLIQVILFPLILHHFLYLLHLVLIALNNLQTKPIINPTGDETGGDVGGDTEGGAEEPTEEPAEEPET